MTNPLAPGQIAPDFTLPGDGDTSIALSDYIGRNVVLFFYPRDDTKGCTQEAKDFTARKAQFAAASTDIIGVSADPISSHDRFKAKHGLDLALASDTEQEMLREYGVWVEKQMYGRIYEGIERTTVLIDRHGRIAQIWRKVKVNGHADAVLAAANTLK